VDAIFNGLLCDIDSVYFESVKLDLSRIPANLKEKLLKQYFKRSGKSFYDFLIALFAKGHYKKATKYYDYFLSNIDISTTDHTNKKKALLLKAFIARQEDNTGLLEQYIREYLSYIELTPEAMGAHALIRDIQINQKLKKQIRILLSLSKQGAIFELF
jgi:hypothetical protein